MTYIRGAFIHQSIARSARAHVGPLCAAYLSAGELSLGVLGGRDEPARDVHPLTRPTIEHACRHLAPQLLQLFSQELHLRTCIM